jgi:hypothetical protein
MSDIAIFRQQPFRDIVNSITLEAGDYAWDYGMGAVHKPGPGLRPQTIAD